MTGETDNTRPRSGEGASRGRGASRREPPVIDLKAEAAPESPVMSADANATPIGPGSVAATPDGAATAVGSDATTAGTHSAAPLPETADAAASSGDHAGAVSPQGDAQQAADSPSADAVIALTDTTASGSAPARDERSDDHTPAAQAPEPAMSAIGSAAAASAAAGLAAANATPAALPPARSGLFRSALAGLVGGIVGAALVGVAAIYLTPVGDYGDRIATLESGLGDKATRRGLETAERRIGAAESIQQTLRTDLDGIGKRLATTGDEGAGAIQRLEQLTRTVTALAARPVPAPEPGRAPEPPPPPPPVPALGARETAVMAVAWLTRDALARGLPYARELDALEASRVDSTTIAALKPFAAGGAPSPARLATALTPLVERMAKPAPVPAEAGVVDRLTAGISRLYRVRPLGGEGEDPASLASRAEAALQRGSLPDALAALEKIPAPAPDLKAVADTIRARIAAGKAADALVVTAVDAVIAATRSGGTAR